MGQIRLRVGAMTSPLVFKRISRRPKPATPHGFATIAVILLVFFTSITALLGFATKQSQQDLYALKISNERRAVLLAAIARYKTHHAGSPPAALADLVSTTGAACAADADDTHGVLYRTLQGWCGPYVDRAFTGGALNYQTDGWGTLFSYDAVTLKSCGPNKTCGNGDDLSDSI